MLDQLEHDDGIEPLFLDLFFGEVFDSFRMGFETHLPTLLDGGFIKFKTYGIPLWMPGLSEELEQASVTTAHIEDLALSVSNEFSKEPDLSAFPDPLESGYERVGGLCERVVVVRIDPVEFGSGGSWIQVLMTTLSTPDKSEGLCGGVVLEVGSARAGIAFVCPTQGAADGFKEERRLAIHARWARRLCLD